MVTIQVLGDIPQEVKQVVDVLIGALGPAGFNVERVAEGTFNTYPVPMEKTNEPE